MLGLNLSTFHATAFSCLKKIKYSVLSFHYNLLTINTNSEFIEFTDPNIHITFSNFSCMFLNPNIFFSNLNSNCSNLLDMRNLQEQVKKAFCYEKLFWPFTVRTNCSSDRKFFCKFSAFSLEFQKFFSITRTIFSHSRSEQFW